MKPVAFSYFRPRSVREAVELLAEGDEATVLAGGQSLIPLMNFRMATPSALVDIGAIPELGFQRVNGDRLCVGAGVRQRDVETADEAMQRCRLLFSAMRWVGHPQIRNRGTVCGSLAHADPSSELPAVAVALDAELVATSVRGTRVVRAADFFQAPYWTVLEGDELVTEVRWPLDPPGTRASVQEYARRAGDFALAGVAMRSTVGGQSGVGDIRMAAFGVAPTPIRLIATEAAALDAHGGFDLNEVREATRHDVTEPTEDQQADAAFRADLLAELAASAVAACAVNPDRSRPEGTLT